MRRPLVVERKGVERPGEYVCKDAGISTGTAHALRVVVIGHRDDRRSAQPRFRRENASQSRITKANLQHAFAHAYTGHRDGERVTRQRRLA